MYAVVMMAALSAGEGTPNGLFGHGCHGCFGCHGCYGGGGCFGCHGCYGCGGCGGCYGWGGGHWMYAGCHGCYGACYGYGYGGWGAVSHGCWGAPYGCYGAWGPGGACYGGCGGYHSPAYAPIPTAAPPMPPADTPKDDGKKDNGKKKDDDEGSVSRRARLVVALPEGAKLYVDGKLIPNAAARKSFSTPALTRGQTYYYEVKAEMMVDDEPVTQTRRVLIRAGQTVREDFSSLATTGVRTAKAR
jgi:uncharacterized protein (TIGR03000 family)